MNSNPDRFVIYEVNLEVQFDVVSQFEAWLLEHIEEMLGFDGFVSASLFELEEDSPERGDSRVSRFCVQYRVENQHLLDEYFSLHAERMREIGVAMFQGKFRAERRVMFEEYVLKSK